MPSDAAESIVFDMNLLQMGNWTRNERKLIEDWIKEDDFDDKRAAAANLLSLLIPEVLSEDCSTVGKIRSKRLGQTLHYFEDLLITTKAGMAKKFYRDHLNHMLRVMILANAISCKADSFISLKAKPKLVVLSSLVHDIAYPIAESYHILGETIKSMSKCYESLSFSEFKVSFNEKKIKQLADLLGPKVLPQKTLDVLLKENDHGLIGAIEFIDYIAAERTKDYEGVFQAVVFHNTSEQIPTALSLDPLVKLLILSDEIQDWGRPIGIEKESAMPAIKEFCITDRGIEGKWEWKNYSNISPLRQVFSKKKNLERLGWPSSLTISLEFKLPKYDMLDRTRLAEISQSLLTFCKEKRQDCIQDFEKAWQRRKELFKIYYGMNIPTDQDLYSLMTSDKGRLDSCKHIHFDPQGKEALVTATDTLGISHLTLSIEKSQSNLLLSDETGKNRGLLFSQTDSAAEAFMKSFMAELIVFQGLSSRITQKVGGELMYPYPSFESTKMALKMIGLDKEETFIRDLRILRRCIVDRGLFVFEKNA